MLFIEEPGLAFRSLARMKGLSLSIILTLALGIGVNVAIFSLVRSVLSAAIGEPRRRPYCVSPSERSGDWARKRTFSVPEIRDLRERVRTISDPGEFSTWTFTMVGPGEPRQCGRALSPEIIST
jgi:putative ABC transport system permease protein